MSESLFSSAWYRVEALKPRLRGHSRMSRHEYRGQIWYVLEDPSSRRTHRLSPAAHLSVGLMDGQRKVSEIWDIVTTRLGDEAPTQADIIQLLGQLHSANLLICDVTPDSLEMFRRYERTQTHGWKRSLMNPLSARIPLFDPGRLLDGALRFVRPCFSLLGAGIWGGVVAAAMVAAGAHWAELRSAIAAQTLSPDNLLAMWLCYPLLKGLHEFGHAFATRVWGGEVHEMGIVFLVLLPVPYVDASAAAAFPERTRRMVVGAAGMIVELFVAALAVFVWLEVEPGLLRSLAFNLIVIGTASTLLFNGNPLLRYDGYYILSDAIGIPNLASRATEYLGAVFQRRVLGIREVPSRDLSARERAWLASYGICSFAYRVLVVLAIALFIGNRFFIAGVILAVWVLTSQLALPVAKQIGFLIQTPRLRGRRVRVLSSLGAAAMAALAVFCLVPVPSWTMAEGVIWLPEQSQVRAGTDGFVERVLVEPGTAVPKGAALIETGDPFLRSQVKVIAGRLRELRARSDATWRTNPAEAEEIRDEITAVEAELAHARERARQIVIRSPREGLFVPLENHTLPGQFVHQGELVGFVTDFTLATARVVVAQPDITQIRENTRDIRIRLVERPDQLIGATLTREIPAGTDQLPSAALGNRGGGSIAIDPSDDAGTRTRETVFQFELELPREAHVTRAGGRVWVRFEHSRETLVEQSYRSLRRLLLGRLGV